MSPEPLQRRRIGSFCKRVKRDNEQGLDLEPLSVTKGRGVVLQSEKYNKRVATDPRKYQIGVDGDFAFDPMSLYYGAIGRIEGIGRGLVSPDYVVFSADDSVDHEFLQYLLRFPPMHDVYESLSETGNSFGKRRRLYWSIFETIELSLPPLQEQRKIAAILSSVDHAIEATQAVIDQLQVVKKAMMAELLTRGLPGRHTTFKMTETGQVPESWAVAPLASITDASAYGPRFPADCYDEQGNVGTLRTTDISEDGEIDYATIPMASLEANFFVPHVLRDGDVLVTRSGTCGIVSVFANQPFPVIPGAFLIRFRLVPEVDAQYVRLALMGPIVQRLIARMAAGGVQKNLSGTNLLTLPVPLPSAEEQAEIVAAERVLDVRLAAERTVLTQKKALKSALMSVLLTGEIRVTPDAEAA
jgi:type I restriction enzyme S subunit